MPQTTSPEQYQAEVLATQLPDAESFEKQRLQAYGEKDAEARSDILTRLVGETMITGADGQKISLLDEVQDLATSNDQELLDESRSRVEQVIATALAAKGHGQARSLLYSINMSMGDGEVNDVHKHTILDQDEAAEARGHRIVREAPSGPKNNRSSKRTPNLVRGQIRS